MMIRRLLFIILVAVCSPHMVSCQEQKDEQTPAVNFGDKIQQVAVYVWKNIHDHPYLSALGLWCAVYHQTACEKLVSYGSHPWLFIPIVGTMLFYLLHDQHDFFMGKFTNSENLELSINLGHSPKKENDQQYKDILTILP